MLAARAIRNVLQDDPLLDWLEAHGRAHGFVPDAVDERTDLGAFLAHKGLAFEAVVLDWLARQLAVVSIRRPEADRAFQASDAAATLQALRSGAPAIARGTLLSERLGLHAQPSLLVRSDVLRGLLPRLVTPAEAAAPAPVLGLRSAHYVALDVRYSTLELAEPDGLGVVRGRLADAGELQLASRLLGELQGFEPPLGLLLGRQARTGAGPSRRLAAGRVPFPTALRRQVDDALAWLALVRARGAGWSVAPTPTNDRLRPNLKNDRDAPWRSAKARIAAVQGELTRLWFVGPAARDRALARGVARLGDPRLSAELLGVRGEPGQLLDRLLEVNAPTSARPPVTWRPSADHPLPAHGPDVVCVHLEATNDLDDDLREFPACTGQPCVYLLSAAHFDGATWRTTTFTSDALDAAGEARLIEAWLAHLRGLARGRSIELPRLITWSAAERTTLEEAWSAAVRRHPHRAWPALRWFDLLRRFVRPNAVVVRGALTFQLPEVVRALAAHGLVPAALAARLEGPDGSAAIAAGFAAARQAALEGVALRDVELVRAFAARSAARCEAVGHVLHLLRRLT